MFSPNEGCQEQNQTLLLLMASTAFVAIAAAFTLLLVKHRLLCFSEAFAIKRWSKLELRVFLLTLVTLLLLNM